MIPNEIFTYPLGLKSKSAVKAREEYYCRFLGNSCDKKSTTISYPMGVCSVNNNDNNPIICPHRFLEDNIVFHDICLNNFGTSDNVLLFKEVHLKNVGSFDFVLVKHRPISSEIEDFCVVEFQSDSTTGTGKLVQALTDYINKGKIEENYGFGLNTYNTIKLSYIQMLIKGQLMEKWKKNIYWIMQSYVYYNMIKRFHLKNMNFNNNNKTKYFVYDLVPYRKRQRIELVEKKSSTIANLMKAFSNQPTPDLSEFVTVLENKVKMKLGLAIEYKDTL